MKITPLRFLVTYPARVKFTYQVLSEKNFRNLVNLSKNIFCGIFPRRKFRRETFL